MSKHRRFGAGQKVYRSGKNSHKSYSVIGYRVDGTIVIENTESCNIVEVYDDELSANKVFTPLEKRAIEMYETHYKTMGYPINWNQCTTKQGWLAVAESYEPVAEPFKQNKGFG